MSKQATVDQLRQAKEQRAAALQRVNAIASKLTSAEWNEETDGVALETEQRSLQQAETVVTRLEGIFEIEARANGWEGPGGGVSVNVLHEENKDKNAPKNYRLTKLLAALAAGKAPTGLELEMHQEGVNEIRSAQVEDFNLSGFMIPTVVSAARQWETRPTDVPYEQRDLLVGTASAGGYAVATNLGELIPFLDPNLVLKTLGATFLTDLVGNLDIPRRATRATAGAVAEQGSSSESNPTFSKLSLAPKRQSTFIDVSIQMMRQSSVSVENLVRGDLIQAIEEIMEMYAVNGSGSSNQPTGILSTVGIGSVVGGTNGAIPDWSDVVSLETALANSNALRGKLGYLTTPGIAGLFKTTKRDVAGNGFIWEGPNAPYGVVNGYKAATSTLVPSTLDKGTSADVCHALVFGNWTELIVAMWGGLEIIYDPYTSATTGTARFTVNNYSDIGLRHAQSFSAMVDALLS